MDALCLSPDNVAAHSLMGDIYFDQGRLDDAIQWYCLAIDLAPDNSADKVKLARAVEERRRQIVNTPRPLDLNVVKKIFHSAGSDPNRTRFWQSERPLRVVIFIASIACLSAIVAWPILQARDSDAKTAPGVQKRIDTSPIFLSPFTDQSSTNASLQSNGQLIADPGDSQLLAKLRDNEELLGRSIVATSVSSDPRSARITITFVSNPIANAPVTRGQISRDAIRVAQAAVSSAGAPPPAQFTMRALAPSQHGGDPLAFVGDIAAGDVIPINAYDAQVSDEAMEAHFTNPWWSAAFSQPAAENAPPPPAASVDATSATPPPAPQSAAPAQGTTPALAAPRADTTPSSVSHS